MNVAEISRRRRGGGARFYARPQPAPSSSAVATMLSSPRQERTARPPRSRPGQSHPLHRRRDRGRFCSEDVDGERLVDGVEARTCIVATRALDVAPSPASDPLRPILAMKRRRVSTGAVRRACARDQWLEPHESRGSPSYMRRPRRGSLDRHPAAQSAPATHSPSMAALAATCSPSRARPPAAEKEVSCTNERRFSPASRLGGPSAAARPVDLCGRVLFAVSSHAGRVQRVDDIPAVRATCAVARQSVGLGSRRCRVPAGSRLVVRADVPACRLRHEVGQRRSIRGERLH